MVCCRTCLWAFIVRGYTRVSATRRLYHRSRFFTCCLLSNYWSLYLSSRDILRFWCLWQSLSSSCNWLFLFFLPFICLLNFNLFRLVLRLVFATFATFTAATTSWASSRWSITVFHEIIAISINIELILKLWLVNTGVFFPILVIISI